MDSNDVQAMKALQLRPPEMSDYTHDLFTGLHAPATFYIDNLHCFEDATWDIREMKAAMHQKNLRLHPVST